MKSIDNLKNTYRAFLMPASLVAASKKDQNDAREQIRHLDELRKQLPSTKGSMRDLTERSIATVEYEMGIGPEPDHLSDDRELVAA